MPITTTWTSGGVGHTLTTSQNSGETIAQACARHIADLRTQLGLYPPDP
jgi:hypothetical protein